MVYAPIECDFCGKKIHGTVINVGDHINIIFACGDCLSEFNRGGN